MSGLTIGGVPYLRGSMPRVDYFCINRKISLLGFIDLPESGKIRRAANIALKSTIKRGIYTAVRKKSRYVYCSQFGFAIKLVRAKFVLVLITGPSALSGS